MLKGKCAFCGEKISLQYPIVELATGIIFCILYMKFGWHRLTFFSMFWVSCLIIMTGTDIKEKIVDCNYAIALGVSGLIYSCMQHGFLIGIRESLLGALLGYVVIELVARVGELLRKGRAMGEGDSFLAMAFGAIVGWKFICWVLFYSLLASMFFVLPVFWYKRYKENDVASLMFSALFIMGIALHGIYGTFLTVGFLALTGTMLAIYIIKTIHQTSNLSYLPFVPAMAAGFMIFLYLY
jgi:leader peptidase (prepilin peptidase)/N-methyltransferase